MPGCVKFTVAGEEKLACCKKCKKVTKFSIMLRRASEQDVLRTFEGMLRKKQTKKGGVHSHKLSSLPQSLSLPQGSVTQRVPNEGDLKTPLTAA